MNLLCVSISNLYLLIFKCVQECHIPGSPMADFQIVPHYYLWPAMIMPVVERT